MLKWKWKRSRPLGAVALGAGHTAVGVIISQISETAAASQVAQPNKAALGLADEGTGACWLVAWHAGPLLVIPASYGGKGNGV